MVKLHIHEGDNVHELSVIKGANLREVLLAHGISPYGTLSKRLNCDGRGLCATCGVYLLNTSPTPSHWHDKLAKQFNYPRLSCKLTIDQDLAIELISEKKIWGKRK